MNDCTIVVPVFNGEKYIAECLDSAITQDCEVIVVNDGSTDGTEKIIDKYNVIKINKPNGGTASALNEGIKRSSKTWIKWLSADDILKPNAVTELLKHVHEIYHIYYTHYDRFGINNYTFVEPDNNNLSLDEKKGLLLTRFYGNGSSSIIHKKVFEKCGYFDETVGYQEDYEFWLRCLFWHNIPLILLDLNIMLYREHQGQLTEQKKFQALNKSESIRKYILSKTNNPQKYIRMSRKYRPRITKRIKASIATIVGIFLFWFTSFNRTEDFD